MLDSVVLEAVVLDSVVLDSVVLEPVVLDSVVELEPVVLDSVVELDPVVLDSVVELDPVVLLVLEELVVVGGTNSRLAELRTRVAFVSSRTHASARTHRVFGGRLISAVEYGNAGYFSRSTTRLPPESSYGVALRTGSSIVAAVVEYHLIQSTAGGFPSTVTLNVPGVDPGSTATVIAITCSC